MDKDISEFAQVMAIIISSVAALMLIGLGSRFLWRLGSQTHARWRARINGSTHLHHVARLPNVSSPPPCRPCADRFPLQIPWAIG